MKKALTLLLTTLPLACISPSVKQPDSYLTGEIVEEFKTSRAMNRFVGIQTNYSPQGADRIFCGNGDPYTFLFEKQINPPKILRHFLDCGNKGYLTANGGDRYLDFERRTTTIGIATISFDNPRPSSMDEIIINDSLEEGNEIYMMLRKMKSDN